MKKLLSFILIAVVVGVALISPFSPVPVAYAATYTLNPTDWTVTFPSRLHPSSTVYLMYSVEIVVADRPDGTTPTLEVSGTLPSGLQFPQAAQDGSVIGATWSDLGGSGNWLSPPTHACTWESNGRHFDCVGKWTLDSTHPSVQFFAKTVPTVPPCNGQPDTYVTDEFEFYLYKQSDMSLKAQYIDANQWYCV